MALLPMAMLVQQLTRQLRLQLQQSLWLWTSRQNLQRQLKLLRKS